MTLKAWTIRETKPARYRVEPPTKRKGKTRARGFASWKPTPESLELVEQVRSVLALFRDYLPVTIRQVFYRLVSTIGFPKTEEAYDRLCETLNRARRSGRLSWDDFRDDGFSRVSPTAWDSPSDWAATILESAKTYRVDRQQGQERRLVLWCEAAGMLPQLARVASDYSVPVFSSGGFDSVTAKHQVAQDFASLGQATVLHVGDLDPSGVHMFGSLDEDVRAFLEGLGAGGKVDFVRLAVTLEQVDAMQLPTSPAKASDRRSFSGQTVQAEAIPPDELARIVRGAIADRLDPYRLEAVLELEGRQRSLLVEQVSAVLESLQ
jgi:hypothetical protein